MAVIFKGTQIGPCANALMMGNVGLSRVLRTGNPLTAQNLPSLLSDLHPLLDPVARGLTFGPSPDSCEGLQNLARHFSATPDDAYRQAIYTAAADVGAYVAYSPFIGATRRLMVSADITEILKAIRHANFLLARVWSGDIKEPNPDNLDFFCEQHLLALGKLHDNLRLSPSNTKRKVFWESLMTLLNIVPHEQVLRHLGTSDSWLKFRIGRYFEQIARQEDGDLNCIREFEGVVEDLRNSGLVAYEESGDVPKIPETERWPHGASDYVQTILKPAFEHAWGYLGYVYQDELKKPEFQTQWAETKEFLIRAYRIYQGQKPKFQFLPNEIVIALTVQKILEPNQRLFRDLWFLTAMMARYIASLPEGKLQQHKESIERDFPEVPFYVEGKGQTIDTLGIARTLKFRPEDKLVMHIGVQGDLDLIKHSIRDLPEGGQVILVDIDQSVFHNLERDPIIQAAIRDEKLIFERTDYWGKGSGPFREKYHGRVDRVYLLHPVGNPVPVVHDITSPNGLVIYQQTANPVDWRYREYDRKMFIEGDFTRLAGYANGPSWFQTEMAGHLSHLGIRFSVAKRTGKQVREESEVSLALLIALEKREAESVVVVAPGIAEPIDIRNFHKEWKKLDFFFRLRWFFKMRKLVRMKDKSLHTAIYSILTNKELGHSKISREEVLAKILNALAIIFQEHPQIELAQIKWNGNVLYTHPKVAKGEVIATPWRLNHLPKGLELLIQASKHRSDFL